MNMKNIFVIVLSTVMCVLISGCARNVNPNTYTAQEVGRPSRVASGVIISKRPVSIDANSGAGGLAGTAAGAAAGSAVGGSPAGNLVAMIGGAVIGGLTGDAIDKSVNHHQGFEYIIRLRKNHTISVVQAANMQFSVRQHVMVVFGRPTRIVPYTMG